MRARLQICPLTATLPRNTRPICTMRVQRNLVVTRTMSVTLRCHAQNLVQLPPQQAAHRPPLHMFPKHTSSCRESNGASTVTYSKPLPMLLCCHPHPSCLPSPQRSTSRWPLRATHAPLSSTPTAQSTTATGHLPTPSWRRMGRPSRTPPRPLSSSLPMSRCGKGYCKGKGMGSCACLLICSCGHSRDMARHLS